MTLKMKKLAGLAYREALKQTPRPTKDLRGHPKIFGRGCRRTSTRPDTRLDLTGLHYSAALNSECLF